VRFCSCDATRFMFPLQVLDDGLDKAGVPYAYGFAIITLTLLVKLATFPLSQKQVCMRLPAAALLASSSALPWKARFPSLGSVQK
jgi:hypothetical protein